jgi:hypothetical protein
LLILLILFPVTLSAQYQTRPFIETIKSLQVRTTAEGRTTAPVFNLGSGGVTISFDELNADIKNYYYRVEHCNADWTPSSLSPLDWADGFTENALLDAAPSFNTTMPYTNYRLELPNSDLRFRLSGNYVVSFYDPTEPDDIIATACFSVLDAKVGIDAAVRGNTDTDIRGQMQQLDFSIILNTYVVENPSELKVFVRQNNRTDNELRNLSPTYIAQGKLTYNHRNLIFEGGTEYKVFDISSRYTFSGNVDRVVFRDPYFHAELFSDRINPYAGYIRTNDVNGLFVINVQEYQNDDTESDYYLVHFTLTAETPFFDGSVYLLGGFNQNLLDDRVQMSYNSQRKCYEKILLLKQGGYNYQYLFMPSGSQTATTKRISGSSWQTENEYTVYVYHRPFGERYDRLIGVQSVRSGL